MSDELTLEGQIQRDADAAVTAAKKGFGINLDFSVESLEHIDTMLAHHYELIQQSDVSPAMIDRVCYVLGSYVGEVIRRKWGGEWGTESKALREISRGPLITLYVR